jgi:tRNA-Thr(GGU) m(6)t(6)A37 methyltransferase TsaA
VEPICLIETPFKEKFGIPRQPMLVSQAWGKMEFPKNDFFSEAFRGIENFDYIWLIFSFHEAIAEGAKALVRPPRFGGPHQQKWGVFATRSPHRPNHLGLSAVKLKSISFSEKKITLHVEGVDLLSGTPILDIKPYLSYCDSYPMASSGPFEKSPEFLPVAWRCEANLNPDLRSLIEKVIGLDPRPRFGLDKEFGLSLAGYNVRFKKEKESFVILSLAKE